MLIGWFWRAFALQERAQPLVRGRHRILGYQVRTSQPSRCLRLRATLRAVDQATNGDLQCSRRASPLSSQNCASLSYTTHNYWRREWITCSTLVVKEIVFTFEGCRILAVSSRWYVKLFITIALNTLALIEVGMCRVHQVYCEGSWITNCA